MVTWCTFMNASHILTLSKPTAACLEHAVLLPQYTVHLSLNLFTLKVFYIPYFPGLHCRGCSRWHCNKQMNYWWKPCTVGVFERWISNKTKHRLNFFKHTQFTSAGNPAPLFNLQVINHLSFRMFKKRETDNIRFIASNFRPIARALSDLSSI